MTVTAVPSSLGDACPLTSLYLRARLRVQIPIYSGICMYIVVTEDVLGWFWSLLHATDAPGCNINIWLYEFLSLNQIKRSVAMYVPPCHEESPLGEGT